MDRSHAGTGIPDLAFVDPEGASIRLQDLKGTPLLINLWATWCAPCVIEMPMLDQLAEERGDSLRVVTVSQDLQGAAQVTSFFTEKRFAKLEPWLDPEGELASHYEVTSLPFTVLYDAEGREVWRLTGDYDWSSAKAAELLAEADGDQPELSDANGGR